MTRVFWEGIILSFAFMLLLVISLSINPRMWLQDYPRDIRDAAPPKSRLESKQTAVISAIILSLMLVPLATSLYFEGDNATFWSVFKHFYIVFTMVSLVDLIILDWVIFCLITPAFIVIPGTEGAKGYKDYLFHLIGFGKGAVMLGVLALLLAGLRSGVAYLL